MKRLLVLLMVMLCCLAFFASCDMLPDEVMDKLNPVLEKVGLAEEEAEPTPEPDETPKHEHSFVLTNSQDATCLTDGSKLYTCECGETKSEAGDPATGHNFELVNVKDPTCVKKGYEEYKCTNCEATEKKNIASTGEEHNYQVTKEQAPTCTADGYTSYSCTYCGKNYKEKGEKATGHDNTSSVLKTPTCSSDGLNKLVCNKCGAVGSERVPATGVHVFDESVGESRILKCTTPACGEVYIREFNGEYKKLLVYSFSDEDLAAYNALLAEFREIISSAEAYDPAKHGYEANKNGPLHEAAEAMEAKYEEIYDVLVFVTGQYQIAQVEYYLDMKNTTKTANLEFIGTLRTQILSEFYSFSKPIYDSMYREFYYYGMTQEEIDEFISDSDSVGNEEYTALNNRNTEIERLVEGMSNPGSNLQFTELYAEFVANNNRIAELMGGYDNYVEYAYANVYDRDYDPADTAKVVEYVKQYIVPVLKYAYNAWYGLWPSGYVSDSERNIFYSQILNSFFDNYDSNVLLNDYIDLLVLESATGEQVSFSEEFDKLFANGNYFHGEAGKSYEGAFVTTIYDYDIPIAYFGPGYDTPFTVAHEFGHYMNEVYNKGMYSQSYDLLEMHSQGDEMLFLYYLSDKLAGDYTYKLVESYNMLNMLSTVIASLSVDTFEQAVYTNTYVGTFDDVIMADGQITHDEYDLLYKGVLIDLGGYSDDGNDDNDLMPLDYWRRVVVSSPCYYVSYGISALSVIQLYPMAAENYDAAIDAYLKLFTYTDVNPYMTTEEILKYAGLYSFTEEELYVSIYNMFCTE